jgi:hypothetical protein
MKWLTVTLVLGLFVLAAATLASRAADEKKDLWRMVGASRLPGYGKHRSTTSVEQYVDAVINGRLFDPVLSLHLKDGWTAVRPIHGYLQHDEASAGWAEVIQWVNPACPPPPELDLRNLPLPVPPGSEKAAERGKAKG